MFALAGKLLGIPVVGSFHTDIIDLLSTHGAWGVQKLCVLSKEAVDSVVLDSCATTSTSFQVTVLAPFRTAVVLMPPELLLDVQRKLATQGVHCEHVIITAVDLATFSPLRRNE
jgi:phenylacetate-coenzyme A ligase PaaK-like adenylate-forming protein